MGKTDFEELLNVLQELTEEVKAAAESDRKYSMRVFNHSPIMIRLRVSMATLDLFLKS